MLQFIFVGRKETTTDAEKKCSEPTMGNWNLIGIMGWHIQPRRCLQMGMWILEVFDMNAGWVHLA